MRRGIAWLQGLYSELKRRRVFRAGAVYALAAWIALQVAAVTFPALFLPRWALTALVVAAAAGLPVTLAAAWAFDLTPEGLRRTEEVDPDRPSFAPHSPVARTALFVLVLLVSGLGGWGAWSLWLRPAATGAGSAGGATPKLEPTKIAVLPFDDLSPSGDLVGVTRGLTEELISELDRAEGLEMVSRSGVEPFTEPEVPLDSVARLLGAGSFVEGSVQRLEGRIRLAVHLVDGVTGTRLASDHVERPAGEWLALRDALVEEVARSIRKELGQEVRLRAWQAGTGSNRAWEAYHRALRTVEFADTLRRSGDPGSATRLYEEADALLARAERLDADWRDPTVQRGWIAYRRARMAGPGRPGLDTLWYRRGLTRAEEVLRDDPGHPGALELRGTLRHRRSRSARPDDRQALLDASEADLRAAVADDPGSARAWAELSLLLWQGRARPGEALMAARRAREADPFLVDEKRYLFAAAALEWEDENLGRAEELARRGRRLFPGGRAYPALHLQILAGPTGPSWPADSAWHLLAEVEDAMGGEPAPPARIMVAGALVRSGLPDSARRVLDRALGPGPPDPHSAYNAGNVLAQLGDTARAVEMLERYFTAYPERRSTLRRDWWFSSLRGDPRFDRLVADPAPSER